MVCVYEKEARLQARLQELADLKQEMADMVAGWDRDGFKDEDCDDLDPDFHVFVPSACFLELNNTPEELRKPLRHLTGSKLWLWSDALKYRRKVQTTSGTLFSDFYLPTSKYLLSFCEGRTLAEHCAHSTQEPFGGGVSFPIETTGMEATVFCHDPRKELDQMYGHPRFPRDRYIMTKAKRNKPLLKFV